MAIKSTAVNSHRYMTRHELHFFEILSFRVESEWILLSVVNRRADCNGVIRGFTGFFYWVFLVYLRR